MTAIPITSEGRASCGSVTQTNSVNTNKARNIGCRGLGGWLTKCRGSETRIGGTGERATSTPAIRQWLRLRTLFSSEKQTNQKKKAERLLLSLLWEQLYRRSSYLSRKCHKKTWMGLAEKLLIVPFVCPLITFFFFFCARPTLAWQECGNITVFTFGSSAAWEWRQWEEVSFWIKIEICHNRFLFIFFFHNSQALSLLYISLCVGLPVNVSVSMCVFPVWLGLAGDCIPPPPPPTIHPLHPLPLVCAAYGHCDGG